MKRRELLQLGAGLTAWTCAPSVWAAAGDEPLRLLVLIELRGGNDGLNTIVPLDDGSYYDLRPRLALRGEAVTALNDRVGLNSALALKPLWDAGEMAILQGVGYAQPNLSHFRSIEIWDTASDSSQYLTQGWLTRVAATSPSFARFSADGVILGAADLGPFAGGARAIALADPVRFARAAHLAGADAMTGRGALAHILRVEHDIARAGSELWPQVSFKTEFPRSPFGFAIQSAATIASTRRVPAIRVTLSGFDTHQNQLQTHANLLRQLGEAVMTLRAALQEIRLWDRTLLITYSEFGRRARENGSGGTDHGTANVMLALGPNVVGGLYGEAPALNLLEDGNLRATTDFRAVLSSVVARWWGLDPEPVFGRNFALVNFLRA
jgi:uncharacterized protein (DUF1501 family)